MYYVTFSPGVTIARTLPENIPFPLCCLGLRGEPRPCPLGGCTVLVHSTQRLGRALCRINQLFGESVFKSNWEDLLPGTGFLGLWGRGMRSRPVRFLPEDGEKEVPEYEERF